MKIKIIQTTDVHGMLFPYGFRGRGGTTGSLARVSEYVKQERNKADQEVVLLDNGDILQGSPIVYYSNFEKTNSPNIVAEVMNYMRYDAGTVGNHDIETGHKVYDKFKQELNFPWMAANAVDTHTHAPYFEPYTIIERQGIRIAVLGLITPGIPNWLPRNLYAGMEYEDMVVSAKKWVKHIREQEKPDLLIGLLHAGIDPYYNGATPDKPKNENASLLVAEQVAGFDVIFAGHDHRQFHKKLTNPEGKPLVVIDPMSHAQKVGVAEFNLKQDDKGNLVRKQLKTYIVDLSTAKVDQNYIHQFKPFYQEVQRYVNKPIGIFTKKVEAKDALFGPSAFMDLIHTAQLELSQADISLASPLSLQAVVDAGRVYVREMFELYKYENFLYTMQFSGAEIKNALEYSYGLWFNEMLSENVPLLNFKRDEKGDLVKSSFNERFSLTESFFNFDSAAGIIYEVDISKKTGERVSIQAMADGSPFDLDKLYRVAVNSYRGNGGGYHLTRGANILHDELPNRILHAGETDLRFNIIKWIEKKQKIEPAILGHWKLVPDGIAKRKRKESQALLFGR